MSWAILFACAVGNVSAQSDALVPPGPQSLEFMYLFAELKNDYLARAAQHWDSPALADLAAEEQYYMDVLAKLATRYGVEISEYGWGCNEFFWDYEEFDFYCSLDSADPDLWSSWERAVSAAAYFEEIGIRELKAGIESTDRQPIVDTYTQMLSMTYTHLLFFASILHDDPFDYDAQLLPQADVDLALTEALADPFELFVINPGLNDAWYDPTTSGQGFFIAVYPEVNTMVLAWLTYDTDLPGEDATNSVGDPCQRWLTAQGSYDGSQADLIVYSLRGGLFDTAHPVPATDPIGSIILNFEDCESGVVNYDLPEIGLSGLIPIQRVASDNVAACQAMAAIAH
jgi:hypothetical protein